MAFRPVSITDRPADERMNVPQAAPENKAF
jgi:hypothetical protein